MLFAAGITIVSVSDVADAGGASAVAYGGGNAAGHAAADGAGNSTGNASPVIVAEDLSMRFGSTLALDSIDVKINHGITGLVGANGAGKSTFLKLVLGLLQPTSGAIETLGGSPLGDGAQVRSRIGYFPERNVLPDTMPAHEFVKHMTQLRGLPRAVARDRASDVLWSVGLGEERFRTMGTMSTGQRQRVKLAQALAADPALVLLDEPTEGLDPVQRESMLKLIGDVRDRHGVDIVMSSHVLGEVEQVCTEVVALDGGTVSIAGRISDLLLTQAGPAQAGLAQSGTAQAGLVHVSIELVDAADGTDTDSTGAGTGGTSADDTGTGGFSTDGLSTSGYNERGTGAGSAAEVQRVLQQAGCTVTTSGQRLLITAPPEMDSYDSLCDLCRDAIADAGARLREMGTQMHSLEEAILIAADSHD